MSNVVVAAPTQKSSSNGASVQVPSAARLHVSRALGWAQRSGLATAHGHGPIAPGNQAGGGREVAVDGLRGPGLTLRRPEDHGLLTGRASRPGDEESSRPGDNVREHRRGGDAFERDESPSSRWRRRGRRLAAGDQHGGREERESEPGRRWRGAQPASRLPSDVSSQTHVT